MPVVNRLTKVSRTSALRCLASESKRWMSMEAQPSKTGPDSPPSHSQGAQSQALEGAQASNPVLDAINKMRLDMNSMDARLVKSMNDLRLDMNSMDARLVKSMNDLRLDMNSMEARLTQTATKNKEEVVKSVSDVRLEVGDLKTEMVKGDAKIKEDLTKEISKLQITYTKIFTAVATLSVLVTIIWTALAAPARFVLGMK